MELTKSSKNNVKENKPPFKNSSAHAGLIRILAKF